MLSKKDQDRAILEEARQYLFCCQKCNLACLKEYECEYDMGGYSLTVCTNCINVLDRERERDLRKKKILIHDESKKPYTIDASWLFNCGFTNLRDLEIQRFLDDKGIKYISFEII